LESKRQNHFYQNSLELKLVHWKIFILTKKRCGVECIHIKGTQASGAGSSITGAGGFCKSRGERAFTTMLMLGLNSASYCTQSAATAAR
jgi:hypothetical protein